MNQARRNWWTRMSLVIMVMLYMVVVIRTAWLSDDVYITLRTVDNFVNGYGLTWNPSERVQGYTHPLWMFALSLFYAVTGEAYFTTLLLALSVSVGAVILLVHTLSTSHRSAILSVLLLALSRAFVDYSTSGLENPLTHLLLVIFLTVYLTMPPSKRKLLILSLVASLGGLNRLDTLVLYIPALLFTFFRGGLSLETVYVGVLGQLPLMAWLAFSCFYYGFPFPNTAYAKLNTGIAFHESVVQGALYVLDSLTYDSLTLLVILTSLIIAWAAYGWQKRAIALGAGLYILYIVRIGGDFMSGRFFTAPLLCAVVLITRYDFEKVTPLRYAIVLISIVVLGLSIPYPTLVSGTVDYETLPARLFLRETGISDEAMFYARDLGLLRYHRDEPMPSHPWREQGEQLRASEEVVVVRNKSIGLYGYYVGPEVHIIDRLALTDPLLARLPARRTVDWRPGHFERVIPAGYIESLQFRRNEIEDPNLARYYDKLTTITQGPLWSPQRWLEIVRINFGAYDELIEPDLYRYPEMVEVTLQEPPSYQPAGTATNAPDNFVLTPSGLDLDLGSMVYAPYIGLSLDHDDAYKLVYFQGERRIAHHIISASHFPWEGLAVYQAEVPKRAQRRGYDRLYILPERGEPPYAVGHVNFHDPVRWITCSQQARCEVKLSDPDVQWLLKRGWASWEDWGRWNLGPQSSLTLYAAAQQAYELQIEAFPLEVDGTCDQSLRLWWNDTYVGERTFDGCEAQMLTFDIDASKVKRENDVLLGYERIYTPDDVGVPLPGETRPLSVGFIAFHLQPK